MDMIGRPAFGLRRIGDKVDEPGRPAYINVCISGGCAQQRIESELLLRRARVEMKLDAPGERRGADAVPECSALRGAGAIVQLEIATDLRQPLRHAQNR